MIVDRPYPTTVAVLVPRTCTRPSLIFHRCELPGLQPSRAAKNFMASGNPSLARVFVAQPISYIFLGSMWRRIISCTF